MQCRKNKDVALRLLKLQNRQSLFDIELKRNPTNLFEVLQDELRKRANLDKIFYHTFNQFFVFDANSRLKSVDVHETILESLDIDVTWWSKSILSNWFRSVGCKYKRFDTVYLIGVANRQKP